MTQKTHGSYKYVKWDWLSGTSASSGACAVACSTAISGKIDLVITKPDSGGTAPSANYDITITNASSLDVLVGNGANLSSASTENIKAASTGGAADEVLTLNVANAGAANGGIVWVYYR